MAPEVRRRAVPAHRRRRRTRTPSSGCSTCWIATTARRPASSPATSTWPAGARRRGPSSARWSRRCTRSRSWSGILGDARLGDRLEKLAFNALPATFKKDMTAHQYDQQCNQVICSAKGEHVYVSNGADANLYGLEPNFGCCTANLHQGWPKFASHLWMKTPDGGLAVVAYAPCVVETKIQGKPVKVVVETEYPFRDEITIKVTVPEPMTFPLATPASRLGGEADDPAVEPGRRARRSGFGAPTRSRSRSPSRDSRRSGGYLPLKARGAGPRPCGLHFPMTTAAVPGIQRCRRHRARPAGLRPADRGRVEEGQGQPAVRRLGGLPEIALELRPPARPRAPRAVDRVRGTPRGQDALLDAGRPGDRQGEGPPRPVVGPGARRRRPAAAGAPSRRTEPLEDLTLIPYGCTDLRITEFPLEPVVVGPSSSSLPTDLLTYSQRMTKSIVGKLTLFVGVLVGLNTGVVDRRGLRDDQRDPARPGPRPADGDRRATGRRSCCMSSGSSRSGRRGSAGWARIRASVRGSRRCRPDGSRRRPERSSPTSRHTRRACWPCGSRTAPVGSWRRAVRRAWSPSSPGRSAWRRIRRSGAAWPCRPGGSRGRMRRSSPAWCAMTTAGCWGPSCWPPTWGPS